MSTLYSQKHERVIFWDMGEERWEAETQFPPVQGTVYRNAEELAKANVHSFQSGTQAALYKRPTYREDTVDPHMKISESRKAHYEGKAPKHTPVDFTKLLHAKSGSVKSWHNATAFKQVKEDVGARLKKTEAARKKAGVAKSKNANNSTDPTRVKKFVFKQVASVSSAQISESRKADKPDDLFNGAFQRAVTAIEESGYKLVKEDVRHYKMPGWKSGDDSYKALKKRLEEHEDRAFKVAKFRGDVVIMLHGEHLDIPVAWINDNGTLYQNTVKGSNFVQDQAIKKLEPASETKAEDARSESGQATNDASKHGMYISRLLKNGSAEQLKEYMTRTGLQELQDDPHVTLAYSRDPFAVARASEKTVTCTGGKLGILGADDGPKHVVLMLDKGSEPLQDRWNYFRKQGAGWDFPDFNPHVTLFKVPQGAEVPDISKYPDFEGSLEFGPEQIELLNEDA